MARRPACSSSTLSCSPSATEPAAASFTADRGDEAHRLDHALLRRADLHGLSRSRVQRLVADGRILVNGRAARRPAQRLRAGDLVRLDVPPRRQRTRPTGEAITLDVRYEDDDLLVVAKPAGQIVHPSFRHASGTLLNALIGHAGPMRRRAGSRTWCSVSTRGRRAWCVVAKSREVQAALQHAADGQGLSGPRVGTAGAGPRPHRGAPGPQPARPAPGDGERAGRGVAVTEYRTLARARGAGHGVSLLECRLVTGRTHQLRVHLADRGWPLVGDPVYRGSIRGRIADPRLHRAAASFERQALHAWRAALPSSTQRRRRRGAGRSAARSAGAAGTRSRSPPRRDAATAGADRRL